MKFHADGNEKKQIKRENFERLLLKSGLIIELESDAAKDDEIFVKLYVPFQLLCEQAQKIKLKMRLDVSVLHIFIYHYLSRLF